MVAPQHCRALCALALLSAGLAGETPRGTYALGKAARIQFVAIPEEKLILGVMVEAPNPPLEGLVNRPVVELRAGGGCLSGRCHPGLAAAKTDEWLRVERVEAAGESLRLDIAAPAGGKLSLSLTKERPATVETPDTEPPAPPAGDLPGIWLAPSGDITRYVRSGQTVRGYVVRIAPAKKPFGFRPGEESVRLRQIGPALYVGTVKARTADGRSWWEPVQIAVQGNTLTYTRHCRSGEVEKGKAKKL